MIYKENYAGRGTIEVISSDILNHGKVQTQNRIAADIIRKSFKFKDQSRLSTVPRSVNQERLRLMAKRLANLRKGVASEEQRQVAYKILLDKNRI